MASQVRLKLDNTIGAAFIGNVIAAALYGVACLQTFYYFRKKFRDTPAFRLLSDTVQLIFVTHTLYHYMITNYANPLSLFSPNWWVQFHFPM
ncbi:hypothetical protein AMATHDRAFT_156928 [Amanita thiersii Skay4041]|uniref:Uncharacterized protein n=1 Tax=Amanita thiersii Skay4041 TaxID=703135 RepID=A0A2A9N9Q0_9AGAR|nr:hypothetical protein AMATHDRAFT_156928 [Amanita thiersii Skay4041]